MKFFCKINHSVKTKQKYILKRMLIDMSEQIIELKDKLKKSQNQLDKAQTMLIAANSIKCPHCGTTELLCGHSGVGCIRKSDEEHK